jgi:chromosomal replication initiation ATPase DnaA
MQILANTREGANPKRLSFSQSATKRCTAVANQAEIATNNCTAVANLQQAKFHQGYFQVYLTPAERNLITEWVFSVAGRSKQELQEHNRLREIARDRAITSAFLHLKYGFTLHFVSSSINRNHTSVVNHCKTIYKGLFYKSDLKKCCELEAQLNKLMSGKGNLFLSTNQIETFYDTYRIR